MLMGCRNIITVVGKRKMQRVLKDVTNLKEPTADGQNEQNLLDATAAAIKSFNEGSYKYGYIADLAHKFGVNSLKLRRCVDRVKKGEPVLRKSGRPTVITEAGIENWRKVLHSNADAGQASTRFGARLALSPFTRKGQVPSRRTAMRILKSTPDVTVKRSRNVDRKHLSAINRVILHKNFKVKTGFTF